MMTPYSDIRKKLIGATICCFIVGGGQGLVAQKVIFPQQQQASTASLVVGDGTYILKNNLLSARFVKDGDKLIFGGCEEMNLKAGTDLFKVVLGDGTSFTSSDMTLVSVEEETLTGKADAVKGSDRFDGKAIKAVFKKDRLNVTWHAVLRDGSHYLRTTLEVTADKDQAMQSITPMLYVVDNNAAKSVPVVVGNTRGAVLASDKIFAGLETPMGVNSTQVANAGMDSFNPKGWNSGSFVWAPGEELPQAIREADLKVDNVSVSPDDVMGARGYVSFRKTGKQTLTFQYTSGNHRLDIVGVDVVDGTGKVLASDYHSGFTGGQKSNNVYTLDIPQTGAYVLRYFVAGTKRSDFSSNGTVTFSQKIAVPVVIYDLIADDLPKASVRAQTLAGETAGSEEAVIYDRNDWKVSVDGWNNDNGTGKAEAIIDGDANTYWHSHYDDNTNKAMPHWFMVDMQRSQPVEYVGFVTRQAAVGVNGHIKDYEIWAGDDANKLTKQMAGTLTYSLGEVWVKLPAKINARYVKVVIKSSQNGAVFACVAEFRVASGNPMADVALTRFEVDDEVLRAWTPDTWTAVADADIPSRVKELDEAYPNVLEKKMDVDFIESNGTLTTTFAYASGANRLNIVGVDLLDASNNVIASDYHVGYTGTSKESNTYSLWIPQKGKCTLRMLVSKKNDAMTSSGSITLNYTKVDTLHMLAPTEVPMQGYWRRNTTLKQGKTWNVSSVVGLVAPGQQRRSFLAYSERERAVPWRAMPVYISWYELNINRNNAKGNGGVYGTKGDYTGNMTDAQCADVVKHWKTDFYDKYGKKPVAFVWDDGWDEYGTWTFNGNFPNGFTAEDNLAKQMGAGVGAWLGPVGGYGASGTYRRNYWKGQGGMQLSNDKYYDYFVRCCNDMIEKYDFRFFKFDGISAQFSATGPDLTDTGLENCEAIISTENDVRKKRPDIFYNTTVGTWASPFWYHVTDATWRQENDYGEIGVGSDREKWITYRDRLVYQNYVQRSPLCPINTLMTHGFILSNFGNVSKDMSYNGVVREMRCAFACGSGMVELYNDYALMNSIKNAKGQKGKLWKELADCMDWQERNADVLPDAHWVGGNPWDGTTANIYGWGAWNGKKATLALRNPDTKVRTLKTTLRKALDIPAYIKTTVTLSSSFADQVIGERGLRGVEMNVPIDIDKEITFTLPASTVFVFEGIDNGNFDFPTTGIEESATVADGIEGNDIVYDMSGRRLHTPRKGFPVIVGGKKVIK